MNENKLRFGYQDFGGSEVWSLLLATGCLKVLNLRISDEDGVWYMLTINKKHDFEEHENNAAFAKRK